MHASRQPVDTSAIARRSQTGNLSSTNWRTSLGRLSKDAVRGHCESEGGEMVTSWAPCTARVRSQRVRFETGPPSMTPGCRRWPPPMCGDEASPRASGDRDPPGKRSGRADDMKPGQRGDEAGSKRGRCRVTERCTGLAATKRAMRRRQTRSSSVPRGSRESDQWDAHEFATRNGALLSIVDWPRPAVLQPRTPSIALLECRMIALGCMYSWMCNNCMLLHSNIPRKSTVLPVLIGYRPLSLSR